MNTEKWRHFCAELKSLGWAIEPTPTSSQVTLGMELEWWRACPGANVWREVEHMSSGGRNLLQLPGGAVKGEFVRAMGELEIDPASSPAELVRNARVLINAMGRAGLRAYWADQRPETIPAEVSEKARYEVLIQSLSGASSLPYAEVRQLLLQEGPGANAALHLHADVDPLRVEWAATACGVLNEWGAVLANLISSFWGVGRTGRSGFWRSPPFRPQDGPRFAWAEARTSDQIAELLCGYPALIKLEDGEVLVDLESMGDTPGRRSSIWTHARPTLANRLEFRSCGIPADEFGEISMDGVLAATQIFCWILVACERGEVDRKVPRLSRDQWEKTQE